MVGLRLKTVLLAGAGFGGLAFVAPSVHANSAPVAELVGLDEIIVTAQRREERLQDVPVSVTALSGAELERAKIADVRALYATAPSLMLSSAVGDSNDLLLGLRGVSVTNAAIVVDPTVGVYLDGVYLARTTGANVGFIDMERVEVLRGPQGTLFGRNTIGGALNITTRKPGNEFEGSVKVEYGNFDKIELTGIVNVPLVDEKLAIRLVANHAEHSGYARSDVLNQKMNNQNQEYVRASVRANPAERIEFVGTFDWFKSDTASTIYKLNYADPTKPAGALLSGFIDNKFYVNHAGFNPPSDQEVYGFSGTFTIDLAPVTVKSITAYRNIKAIRGADLDGSPLPLTDFYHNDYKGDQFTQEVQLYGDALDGRLNWITGAFYFQEQGDTLTILPQGPNVISFLLPGAKNRSASAFAQVTYEVIPKLRATAGIRYVKDTRQVTYNNFATTAGGVDICTIPASLNQGGCFYTPAKAKFEYAPWTLGLDYKPSDDVLLYAKVTKGYRSGGFPLQGGSTVAQFAPFDEENLMSYELGTKIAMLDKRLRIGASAYYSRYDKIQQNGNAVDVGTGVVTQTTQNIGSSDIWGGELEVAARIGDLRLSGGLGLIDPKYTDGPALGTPVVLTPKTTWTFSADYPIDLSFGTVNLHADYNHRTKVYYYNTIGMNQAQANSVSQKGYGLLNASVSLELTSPHILLTAWGKNLTDEKYAQRTMNFTGAGFNVLMPGDPRTYGMSLEYKF